MLNVLYEYPNDQPITNMQEGLYDAGSLDVPQGSQQQSSQNYYLSNINAQSSQIVNQNNYQYFQIQQYSSIHYGNTEDEKFQFFSIMSNLNNTHNQQHSQNQVNTQFDEQQLFNQSSNNLANGYPLEDNYLDQFLNNQETGQKQLFTNMLQQDYENEYQYQNDFFNQNTLQQCLLDYKEVNQYYFDQDNQLNFKEGCFQPKESDTQQTNYENQIASSNSIVDPAKNSLEHHQKNLNITIEILEVRASEQNISNEEIKSLNLFSYCQNNTKAQAEIINNQEIKEYHNNFGDLPPNNISGVSESYDQKYNFINNCIHKKNVVKNIINQFKSFVFINKECNQEIDSTKKGFQKNLKSLFSQEEIMSKNQQIVQLYSQFKQKQETLQQIQMKFQRYIKLKSSNNYNLILLIQHQQYKFIFKYFLNNYAKQKLQRRKIKNIDSHIQFIDFLLDSFSNPEILSILKKHDKKKPVYS